jgi:hypothetical protein
MPLSRAGRVHGSSNLLLYFSTAAILLTVLAIAGTNHSAANCRSGVTVPALIIGGVFSLALLSLVFYGVHKTRPQQFKLKVYIGKFFGIETEIVGRGSTSSEVDRQDDPRKTGLADENLRPVSVTRPASGMTGGSDLFQDFPFRDSCCASLKRSPALAREFLSARESGSVPSRALAPAHRPSLSRYGHVSSSKAICSLPRFAIRA